MYEFEISPFFCGAQYDADSINKQKTAKSDRYSSKQQILNFQTLSRALSAFAFFIYSEKPSQLLANCVTFHGLFNVCGYKMKTSIEYSHAAIKYKIRQRSFFQYNFIAFRASTTLPNSVHMFLSLTRH